MKISFLSGKTEYLRGVKVLLPEVRVCLPGVKEYLREAKVLLLEVRVCLRGVEGYLRGVSLLLLKAEVLLLEVNVYLRVENLSLRGATEYFFKVEVLLQWELAFCPIGNNSLSVDKELFLFKTRKKKGYSESERIETISDKPEWCFTLNRDIVLNIKLRCVNPVIDGLFTKVKVIKY